METRRTFLKQVAMAGTGILLGRQIVLARTKGDTDKKPVSLEEAWALHKKCLIIDGHNDVPVLRMAKDASGQREIPLKWMQRDNVYQTDLVRARENGQQYVAFMIMAPGRGSAEQYMRNVAEIASQVEKHPKDIRQVLTSADAVAAGAAGQVGVINAIEGGSGPLGGDLENLKKFYEKGLRLAGITHGEGGAEAKYLQGAPSKGGKFSVDERKEAVKTMVGLTPFGLEALKLSNELGIITDLAHSNDKTFMDVMEKSTLPPIASHTAVYALCQVGRCMTDDQIKALAAKGGVMGICFVPGFLDNDAAKVPNLVDRFVDHLCYVADLVGVDTVGVGSDFDGGIKKPVIADVSQFVQITQGMMARGFSEEEIRKIWSGNFLRVMKKTIDLKKQPSTPRSE
jgi:membrane dipeptidase